MKTQKIIATIALLIFSASFSIAGAPKKLFTLHNAIGNTLSMPMIAEDAAESLPFNVECEFHKVRYQEVNQVLDISSMIKPEEEVNDIDIDLQAVYQSMIKK